MIGNVPYADITIFDEDSKPYLVFHQDGSCGSLVKQVGFDVKEAARLFWAHPWKGDEIKVPFKTFPGAPEAYVSINREHDGSGSVIRYFGYTPDRTSEQLWIAIHNHPAGEMWRRKACFGADEWHCNCDACGTEGVGSSMPGGWRSYPAGWFVLDPDTNLALACSEECVLKRQSEPTKEDLAKLLHEARHYYVAAADESDTRARLLMERIDKVLRAIP